jgi:glycosyltransferase involved in cell wall biosynthesis
MAELVEHTEVDRAAQPALVSIALCTYNGAKYLAEQLESLLAQTYEHLEIVASDDASTDDTLAILNDYARRDPRIKVFAHPDNVGLTRNFERALLLCSGSHIAPCDQDDLWSPEKISKLIAVLGDRALAYCDSQFVDEQGTPLGKKMSDMVRTVTTDDPLPFAFANCVSGHAMLFKREVLKYGVPVPPHFFYDWWLATVAAASGGIVYLDEPLVRYRQHATNITDTLGRRDADKLPRGHSIRFLDETLVRLEAIAKVPGEHAKFAAKMSRLWRARERQWLSLRLGWLMTHHRDRLFCISRTRGRTVRRQCRQYFYGLRVKRLTNPYEYTMTDTPHA